MCSNFALFTRQLRLFIYNNPALSPVEFWKQNKLFWFWITTNFSKVSSIQCLHFECDVFSAGDNVNVRFVYNISALRFCFCCCFFALQNQTSISNDMMIYLKLCRNESQRVFWVDLKVFQKGNFLSLVSWSWFVYFVLFVFCRFFEFKEKQLCLFTKKEMQFWRSSLFTSIWFEYKMKNHKRIRLFWLFEKLTNWSLDQICEQSIYVTRVQVTNIHWRLCKQTFFTWRKKKKEFFTFIVIHKWKKVTQFGSNRNRKSVCSKVGII